MSNDKKAELFFCPKYGKAERCPMVKEDQRPAQARITELEEALKAITKVEVESKDSPMDIASGFYKIATEALAKAEGK